jgi:hypothetical protein
MLMRLRGKLACCPARSIGCWARSEPRPLIRHPAYSLPHLGVRNFQPYPLEVARA